jgi:acyl-CoA reductase-like NAD-dependent aldehyde dehydrogenase
MLGEILAETNLPRGAFSILPCHREGADLFTTDERIKLLSFTGSPAVGWALKARAGKKKVVLELGGNAACLVDEDADLDDAVARILVGAFYQSGQSCISVQRILVHERVYAAFRDKSGGGRPQAEGGRSEGGGHLHRPHHLVEGSGPHRVVGGVRAGARGEGSCAAGGAGAT